MKTLITLFFISFIITGCNETKQVIDVAGNVHLLGSYTITMVNDQAINENAPTFTLSGLDKSIKGHTGCNSFFGSYELNLYNLSFKDVASTERACDQPIMDIENAFLRALSNTGSYDLENSMLTLYSKTDRSILAIAKKEVN